MGWNVTQGRDTGDVRRAPDVGQVPRGNLGGVGVDLGLGERRARLLRRLDFAPFRAVTTIYSRGKST
jgi:hypothetical protein